MTHHTFNIKAINPAVISMEVSEEMTLPEIIEAFEAFLYAVGYRFPEGATLGYEWDEEGTDPVY